MHWILLLSAFLSISPGNGRKLQLKSQQIHAQGVSHLVEIGHLDGREALKPHGTHVPAKSAQSLATLLLTLNPTTAWKLVGASAPTVATTQDSARARPQPGSPLGLRPLPSFLLPPSSNPCRAAPPEMFWGNPAPAPPAPPPTVTSSQLIRRDVYGYLGLLATVAVIPAIDWAALGGAELANFLHFPYFVLIAVGSIYYGVQRREMGEAAPLDNQRAASAPIAATVVLGSLYLLITYLPQLNPALVYRFFACIFGCLSGSLILEPLLGMALTGELFGPESEEIGEERDQEIAVAGSLPSFLIPLLLVVAYLQGPAYTGGLLPENGFAAVNNFLCWTMTMTTLGIIAPETFLTGAGLLVGLFCYDAFFVFKSDVMVTVATGVEAPVKFLFERVFAAGEARYPFSIFGLGDIVVPGIFVSLMRDVDEDFLGQSSSAGRGSGWESNPYFYNGLIAYVIGVLLTFGANFATGAGQPALVYIVPSLLLGAASTALSRGELKELLDYKSTRAAAARAEMEAEKEELSR